VRRKQVKLPARSKKYACDDRAPLNGRRFVPSRY
jgi:hypothetical protein